MLTLFNRHAGWAITPHPFPLFHFICTLTVRRPIYLCLNIVMQCSVSCVRFTSLHQWYIHCKTSLHLWYIPCKLWFNVKNKCVYRSIIWRRLKSHIVFAKINYLVLYNVYGNRAGTLESIHIYIGGVIAFQSLISS